MRSSTLVITRLFVFCSASVLCVRSADVASADLDRKFTQKVQPFVNSYCIGCHSGTTPAAQFDLKQYTSTAAVIRDYPRWSLVLDKLNTREMPPKAMKQPPEDARKAVIEWV